MQNWPRLLFQWEWLFLLFLLPVFLFPEGFRGLVLLVIPLLWLNRKFITGRFFPSTPYNIPIFTLLVMLALSLLVTFDFELSLPKISMLLFGVALFFATVEYSRNVSVWPVLVVYLILGVLMALVGLVGVVWEPPFHFLNGIGRLSAARVPGTVDGIINANELAGVLCWIAPIMLACSIGLSEKLWNRYRPFYVALLFATGVCVFLLIATGSRGGIFAFAAGAVTTLALFSTGRWRLVLIIAVSVILLILAAYVNSRGGQDIVGDTLGLSGRFEIWSRALLVIRDHPLMGVSVNGFRRIVTVLYPLFSIAENIDLAHAHNHLLQVALDLGLPGMVAYLGLWLISAGLLWAAVRSVISRHARSHPYYTLLAGLAGAYVAGWMFGIVDAVALGSRPSFMWWLLLSLTASTHYAVVYSGERLRPYRRSKSQATTDGSYSGVVAPAVYSRQR